MNVPTLRYHKGYSAAFVAIGVILALTSLATEQWITLASGGVIALLGVLMLVNPMLRFEPHEVQQKNPLGMTIRRFPMRSPADLRVDGKNLVHVPTGKRAAALGLFADKADVEWIRTTFGPGQQPGGPAVPPGQQPQHGQMPPGQAPYGQQPGGPAVPPAQQPPHGQVPHGQPPHGQAPHGQAPYGEAPAPPQEPPFSWHAHPPAQQPPYGRQAP